MENKTTPIVEIKDLIVHYETDTGVVEAVNNISLTIEKGEVLGLVGETGAGKTSIALSIMGLLPKPPAHIIPGSVKLDGNELIGKRKKQMQKIRGKEMSMIFQDPMTALNPVHYVGDQIAEVIRLHDKCSRPEAVNRAKEMMETVGIPAARYKEYPHQFSGGMKQRIIIAIALACEPKLLIADEPTTALDVTIQAQILELMKGLQREKGTAMLMITHDLGVVAEMCDKCAVLYAGEIVEYGSLEDIFEHPMHPYTVGLFNAIPNLEDDKERLFAIPGMMADPTDLPQHCSYCNRCDKRCDQCEEIDPKLVEVTPGHFVKCIHARGKEEA